MFHLLLAAPVLAVFGAAAIFVLSLPFWVGGLLQLFLTAFCRKKPVYAIPAALGVVGVIASAVNLVPAVGVGPVAVYWLVYFVELLLIFLVVYNIKRAVLRLIDRKKPVQPPKTANKGALCPF